MIKIAFVDDEKSMHSVIVDALRKSRVFDEIEWDYKSYYTSETFLDDESSHQFDIMLLDIELPGLSGIQLSKQMQITHPHTKIIFLTSYENHLKYAYGLNVFRYIMKEDIHDELSRYIRELIEILRESKPKILKFKTLDGQLMCQENEILCVLFERRRPVIYTKDIKYPILRMSLKDVYDKLDKSYFVMPHSGSIVNVKYIKTLSKKSLKIKHLNSEIIISRGRYQHVFNKLAQYERVMTGRLI